MLTLTVWDPPGIPPRIYIKGLDYEGKSYCVQSCGGVKVIPPPGADAATVENIIAQTFQLATPLKWADLLVVARTDFRKIRGKKIDVRTTVPGTIAAGGFTDANQIAIATEFRSNPIPFPTTLLFDHREPEELKRLLEKFDNLIVKEELLDVGDMTLPGIVTFERKTVRDFCLSITEDKKRLFHQVERMILQPGRSIFLIEGDLYREGATLGLEQKHIDGALSYLITQGAVPYRTISLPHTAFVIAKIVRIQAYGLGYDIGLRGSEPKKAPIERKALFVTEGLPGISARLAKVLLTHFGTIQALANATEADLRSVPGIGPKISADIAAIFRCDIRKPAIADLTTEPSLETRR